MDDAFTLNRRRAESISNLIDEEGLDFSWTCSSRVSALTLRLLQKLRRAGCDTLYFGVESGSQRILDFIKKGITLDQSKRAVEIVKRVGIKALASFMLGIPGETINAMRKTIAFAKKLNPSLAQFTICTPYPGTELYVMAEEKGWLSNKDWSKYTTLRPVLQVPNVSSKKIKHLLFEAYVTFYLRPGFILNSVKERDAFFIMAALRGIFYNLSNQ
jgi:radical SAM superfamily enzyme YgiQ (UPF0313 family)